MSTAPTEPENPASPRLSDVERARLAYAAEHLISGTRSLDADASPDPHAADSVDLAWDEFAWVLDDRTRQATAAATEAIDDVTAAWRERDLGSLSAAEVRDALLRDLSAALAGQR